jgi:hypothetical protein
VQSAPTAVDLGYPLGFALCGHHQFAAIYGVLHHFQADTTGSHTIFCVVGQDY